MRKIFTLLLFILSLPAVALAATYDILWIGNTRITDSGYWTTNDSGNLTASDAGNYNVAFNADTHTLTLNNANIAGQYDFTYNDFGAGIYAYSRSGAVSLTIQVEGNNVVSGNMGVYAFSYGDEVSVTISGGGSLTASGSLEGIMVQSNSDNAILEINNAKVSVTSEFGIGVMVQASSNSTASLTVEGGSLTASGRKGIQFYAEIPQLKVNNSTIVRGSGGIAAGINEDVTVPTNGVGIVFNGSTGTVYGNASLQDDLIIGEGERLILDNGANLDANGHNVIVDGGTLDESLAESLGGSVIYKVTKVELDKDNLTLEVGESSTLTTTITPDNATDKSVTWESSAPSVATVENGTVTAVGAGTTTITVETKDGEFTATCEVTVSKATPTIQVTVPSDAVYDGKAKTATATVKDINGETLNETVAIAYYTTTDRTDANKVDNPTDAGTYYVTATFAGNDDYVEVTDKNSSFTIGKAKPTINLIVPTGEDLIYNGQAKAATATVIGVEGETLDAPTITYYMDAGMTTAAASTIDIGTYYVKAVYAESTNYESVEKIGTFTVTTANITITRPEEQEGTITLEPGSMSFTLTATISGLPESERNGTWNWVSHEPDVAKVEKLTPITTRAESDIISTAQVTPVSEGTATITVTYTSKNYTGTLTYAISVKEKEEPEPPVIPDYPDYYNIYVDECEGVTVETSTNVVREGNSMTFTVDVEEGYTGENMTVKVKRSLFGYSEIIKPNEKGIYEVKNIYTEIYITVDGVEEVEEPTGIGDVENTKVYAKDGSIYVQTPKLKAVTIISISGAIMKQEELIGLQRYDLPRGIYIICIGEERIKVRN